MPESVRDRCTKAHEYVFLLAKSERIAKLEAEVKVRAITCSSETCAAREHLDKYIGTLELRLAIAKKRVAQFETDVGHRS